MENKWKNYRLTLIKEVGEEIAEGFVQSLLIKSGGSEKAAEEFFYELGKQWGPLMNHWSRWILEKAKYSTIALILRDAKPLEVIQVTKEWKRLYLNRSNCGISDELSGDNTKPHPLLEKYLEQSQCLEPFTFVDSGCYGTIVLELHKRGIIFQPLFFFSKNPFIPGFLNELGVGEKEGTILNDSLECAFPNVHLRPSSFSKTSDGVGVSLLSADELSTRFGLSALKGVKDSQTDSDMTADKEMEKLLSLSFAARQGSFTGLLPHESPEWSQKKSFLDSWPKELSWV